MPKMLTVKEVAEHYSIGDRQVLYAIKKKLLKAEKYGWQWMLEKDTLPKQFPVRNYSKKRGAA